MGLLPISGIYGRLHHGGAETEPGCISPRSARTARRVGWHRRPAEHASRAAGMTDGVAPPLVAGNIEETWRNAGAAEAHPRHTDNKPSDAARPTPGVTAFPIPTEPNPLLPEPTPRPSVHPKARSCQDKVLAAGRPECMR